MNNAEQILTQSGYINATDAAKVLKLSPGGNIADYLARCGVEHVVVPFGENKSRKLFRAEDVERLAVSRSKNKKADIKDIKHDEIMAELVSIRRAVIDICEQLGIEPKFDA